MHNWREYIFSDFVEINPKVSLKGKESYSFVEMKDLQDGNKFCFPSAERNPSSGARFTDGDTLFARITPCLENGKICQVKGLKNGVGFGSTEFLIFRGKESLSNNDFVFYLSRWDEVRGFAESRFEGSSGRQRVPKNCFDNLILSLPPLPEQKAIAEVLSSLDDKIDLLHRQNQTLEQLAQTLFRKWFIEEAKEEWETKPLSAIADFLNGLACQKFAPKNELEKLPVLKIRELKEGFSENSDWASTDIDSKYFVTSGDIIFSWSASLVVKIWDGGDCILNQHLFKVTSKVYPKWFYYLWSQYHLQQFIAIANAHATTMGHIKRGDLDEAMVNVPSPDEINEMSKTFEPLIEKIIANNKQIKTLEKQRNTLLPKLMSGEVRVKID